MAWRRFFRRRQRDADLLSEIESYLAHETDWNIERGMAPARARAAARQRFGNITGVREREHDMNSIGFIESAGADLRFAWRGLINNPGFTFFAVLTIALGLGANAAIFSLVDGVLLKSSGYSEPQRIVRLFEVRKDGGLNGISGGYYLDWVRMSRSFESMAAVTGANLSYTGSGEPQSLDGSMVSSGFFDVFGAKAALGRTFARDEDQPGKEKVVVLSHRCWVNRFGADRTLVGRSILLNGERYSVIGILPGSSDFDRYRAELWIPLVFPADVARDYHYLGVVAKLKRGVKLEQAQAEMTAISKTIGELHPIVKKKGWSARVLSFSIVRPQMKLSLTVLMCAVAAVLLIGCANLANLLMARATLRSREIALRMALGARRGRVIRLLLTESLLLSICGAAAGVLFGYGLLRWIQTLLPPFYFPAEANIALDARVLLFLGAITALACIAFGLAPAVQASRRDAAESLKEGGRNASAGRKNIYGRQFFVGAQVTAAFILLVGSGLLIRSFNRLMSVDTGFKAEGLMSAYLPLPVEANPDAAKLKLYVDQLVEAVRGTPGISEAAVATAVPLRGWGDGMPMRMADSAEEGGTGFKIVTPHYFQALGLPLLAGRLLTGRDTANAPPVVVVNDSFVKRYSPDRNPIGRRILVQRILPSRRGLGAETAWEIVGVVADEKGNGLDSPTDVGAYASFAQNPAVGIGLVARGAGEPGTLIKSVQQAIWRVNKNQVLDRPMMLEEVKRESVAGRRLPAVLLGGFAIMAMFLACAGIYGVLSFVTASRTQEIGIRTALGATRGDVIAMVVRSGSVPVFAGVLAGLAGSIALSRLIESMLFATDPVDWPTLASVSVLFLATALAACLVPAWRASRIQPMSALRQE